MEKAVLAAILALAAPTAFAQSAADPAGARGPANLCQELLAFMEAPPPAATAAPAAPAQAAKAEPAKEGAAAASPGTGAADAAPAAPAGAAKEGASSQQATGQSGPATDAPDPNVTGAKVGKAEDAPQKASVSAPVPTDGKSVSKESVLSVAEAESLAAANDIAACQTAARELRIAGVAVPPPLLALTALDLKYQSTTRP
jgi:hypothetical protein